MKLRVRRISPATLAATLAVFYFVFGLFVGLFGVVGLLAGGEVMLGGPVSFSLSDVSMLPLAILYPFMAATVGAIAGFLIAWLYNFTVRFTKGILIDFSEANARED